MVAVFANNQTLVCVQGTDAIVYTDPVSLGDNDRLSAMLNVHSLVSGGGVTTRTLTITAQVSNDGGQNYVASSVVTDTTAAIGIRQVVGTVNGALVRFMFRFGATGGSSGDFAGCCFDLHVNMDHV